MSPGRILRPVLLGGLFLFGSVSAGFAKWTFNPRSNVGFESAVLDAMVVAMQKPDRSVVRMAGDSMLPFFGGDSIAVIQKIPAARLRIGMIAVYTNFLGEKVAHRVIAQMSGGWKVQGYNNAQPDSTIVSEENLLGVVYATFNTAGSPAMNDASTFGLMPAMDVVMGASAK